MIVFIPGELLVALQSGELPPPARDRRPTGDFKQYDDCSSCVAAGYGWSHSSGKCGHYRNKEC
jgi:hypothetical protein